MEQVTGNLIHVMFYFIFLSCLPMLNGGTSLQDVQSLRNYLFTNKTYDTKIRPVYNQSNALTISMSATFISLSKLSVTAGRVEVYGYVTSTWKDQILQWNPDHYGGLEHLDLSLSDIWVPDFLQVLGSDNDNMFESIPVLKLHPDGTVLWIAFGILYGICDQRMEYFPYDEQTCYTDTISSKYDSSELNLTVSRRSITMLNPDNGQWKWANGHSGIHLYNTPGQHGSVAFVSFRNHFSFQRRPDFIMVHMAVPYNILLFLNLFVYLTPLKSGERISFAVTLLLAFAFYSTYISEKVPENSNSISIISIYSAITLAMCTFTVASSIVLCKLIDEREKDVPRWLKRLSRLIVKLREISDEIETEQNSNEIEANQTNTTCQNQDTAKTDGKTVNDNIIRSNSANPAKVYIGITWTIAANALDRICFGFNCFALLVTWIFALVVYKAYL